MRANETMYEGGKDDGDHDDNNDETEVFKL